MGKFDDNSGLSAPVGDPYEELFKGLTPEEAVQLQHEINRAEGKE